jgi:hypothetical protein
LICCTIICTFRDIPGTVVTMINNNMGRGESWGMFYTSKLTISGAKVYPTVPF